MHWSPVPNRSDSYWYSSPPPVTALGPTFCPLFLSLPDPFIITSKITTKYNFPCLVDSFSRFFCKIFRINKLWEREDNSFIWVEATYRFWVPSLCTYFSKKYLFHLLFTRNRHFGQVLDIDAFGPIFSDFYHVFVPRIDKVLKFFIINLNKGDFDQKLQMDGSVDNIVKYGVHHSGNQSLFFPWLSL